MVAGGIELIVGYFSPDVDAAQFGDAVKDGLDKAIELTDCKNMILYWWSPLSSLPPPAASGRCFCSTARAYAARTRACFSLVGKAGKSTPEPDVLDSPEYRPILYVLLRFTLRSGRLAVLWAARSPCSCGYALPEDFAAAPIAPACFPVLEHFGS